MTGIAAVIVSLVAEILELGYCICIESIRHTGHGLPGKIINTIHITAETAFIYQFLHLLAKVVVLNIEFKVLQENGFSRLVVLFDIVQQHHSASLIILINFADNIQHKDFIDKSFGNLGDKSKKNIIHQKPSDFMPSRGYQVEGQSIGSLRSPEKREAWGCFFNY